MSLPDVPGNPLLLRPDRGLPGRVAIVGAGTIGPDIGYYLATALPGLDLTLVDVAQAPLDKALARLEGYTRKGVARRKLTEETAAQVLSGLRGTTDYDAIAGCDWVIEAATEDLTLKRRIFADIERRVGDGVPITSNTSSLPAGRMFGGLSRPERATVTHFFAPAWRNPAVEVVHWEQLDPGLLAWLRWVFASTGKVPFVTADVPCFMLDRVFDNWCNDAALLLDRATAAQIDSVAAAYVGAGPFFVLNLTQGNPIVVEANTLQMEEGPHYAPADILRSVKTWNTVGPGGRVDVPDDVAASVRDRLLGVLWSQSYEILDREVATAADLELGCVLALGFKEGPLGLAARSPEATERTLRRFATERPGMPLPQRPLPSYQSFRRHVLVDDVEGVDVITIRRPQALNALDDRVNDEILEVIQRSKATGFVLTGYGAAAFSAGADIGRFPEMLGDAEAAARYARDCSRLLLHLDQMDRPVVAALNGMALGGGLELAIRCHAIVSLEHAWLQFPEINLGIVAGTGGLVVPYRKWPAAAAVFHDMLRHAHKLTARQAEALGVVDAIATDVSDLLHQAVARVRVLERGPLPDGPVDVGDIPTEPPPGLSSEVAALVSDAIRRGAAAPSWGEALEIGYRAFGASALTAAASEGVGAFLAKRRPDFAKTG